jgi:hypothetical protein
MKPLPHGLGDFHDDELPSTIAAHGPMRRIYGDVFSVTIYHGKPADYIEKAYRGETVPAGMTTPQVRAIVDAQVKRRRRGMANGHRYKTLRGAPQR